MRRSSFAGLALPLFLIVAACSEGASTTSSSSSSSAASSSSSSGSGGGGAAPEPEKPAGLVSYLSGDPADAEVTPAGPGLILMGGGTDVDAAFTWWKPLLAGGDVVVLRTSGEDGYDDYLFSEIGGVDSVETLLVTDQALASSPYVKYRLDRAEGIFLAGGDQATYLKAWKDTPVEDALKDAWKRGAVVGGTSAGCAVLGELVFAAYNDTVYSDEALADPYNTFMTMERDFLSFPPLAGAITDTHFHERDRMGRLVGFLARLQQDGWADAPLGIGVDEETALVVDANGKGTVLGNGSVYLLRPTAPPAVCAMGQPLEVTGVDRWALSAGDTVSLPSGATTVTPVTLAASAGSLSPADPY